MTVYSKIVWEFSLSAMKRNWTQTRICGCGRRWSQLISNVTESLLLLLVPILRRFLSYVFSVGECMGEKTFKTVKLRGGYFLKTVLSVKTGVLEIFKLHFSYFPYLETHCFKTTFTARYCLSSTICLHFSTFAHCF